MSYIPSDSNKTAFGEDSVAQPTPVVQIMAPYGLLDKAQSFELNGGSGSATDSLFEASTGTNSDGFCAILTRRQVSYRPGQGILARFTTIYDTPATSNRQLAGFAVNADRLVFGYNASGVFGIARFYDGDSEIQELTITTAAGGSENATVTVDGVGYTVPLTSGTVQHNAFEIAESLNSQTDLYDFSSNDDQVVARSLLFGNNSSFAFSSSSAVASWSQIVAGSTPDEEFIAQADWNIDTMSGFDPQKGNVYQIRAQYLGFGAISFYIEDSDSGAFVEVHRIKYANTATTPSVSNPTFRVGWWSENEGNTTDVVIKGASAAGFVEGYSIRTEPPRALDNTNLAVGSSGFENIITLRNRLVLDGRRNRTEVFGLGLSASTTSTKGAILQVLANATISGDLDYQYIDKPNSVVEYAFDNGNVTGGRLVTSVTIPPQGGVDIDLERIGCLLLSGETLTFASRVVSGSASEVTVATVWQEDL